jgi:hypothetical protein
MEQTRPKKEITKPSNRSLQSRSPRSAHQLVGTSRRTRRLLREVKTSLARREQEVKSEEARLDDRERDIEVEKILLDKRERKRQQRDESLIADLQELGVGLASTLRIKVDAVRNTIQIVLEKVQEVRRRQEALQEQKRAADGPEDTVDALHDALEAKDARYRDLLQQLELLYAELLALISDKAYPIKLEIQR